MIRLQSAFLNVNYNFNKSTKFISRALRPLLHITQNPVSASEGEFVYVSKLKFSNCPCKDFKGLHNPPPPTAPPPSRHTLSFSPTLCSSNLLGRYTYIGKEVSTNIYVTQQLFLEVKHLYNFPPYGKLYVFLS